MVEGGVGVALGFVEEGDELGADDGAGGVVLGGLEGLGVRDAEAYHAGVAEVHGVDAAEVGLLGVVEALLGTGYGGGGDHVDEAVGVVVDEADAVVGGLGGDEHDDAEVVLVGDGLHLSEVVVEGEVGDDHAGDAGFGAALAEGLDAVVEDGVEVAHENQGDVDVDLDGFQLVEELGKGHAVLEGLRGGCLDDGAVGEGVAEGDADLDEVNASFLHRQDDVTGAVEGGTAGAEVEAE